MHQFSKLRVSQHQYYDNSIEIDSENSGKMQDIQSSFNMPKEKTIAKATVSNVTREHVWVNIGIKSEGKININEFKINGFGEVPKVGDAISVWIEKHEDSNGNLVISYSKVNQIRSWKELEEIFQAKKLIEGTMIDKVRGGFVVALLPWGVKAFLPSSQIDYSAIGGKSSNILQVMKNKKIQLFIIRLDRKWNIIVSQKNEQNKTEQKTQQ